MSGVGYLCALVLAGSLAWAAVAKLVDPTATVTAFTELRLPGPRPLARLVPVVEAAIAIALVVVPRAGALASLVTLACFTGVLVARLRDGPPVRCGCFGSRSDEEISFVDPLRNGLLALLAMAAMVPTSPVMPHLEDIMAVSAAATTGFVVLGVARLVREVRTSRRLLVLGAT